MCWSDDTFSQTSAQLSPKEHHQASCCEELSYTRATRVFYLSFYPKCKPSSDSFSKTGGLKSLWQKKKRVERCGLRGVEKKTVDLSTVDISTVDISQNATVVDSLTKFCTELSLIALGVVVIVAVVVISAVVEEV